MTTSGDQTFQFHKKFSAACIKAPGTLDHWMECMFVRRVIIAEAGI